MKYNKSKFYLLLIISTVSIQYQNLWAMQTSQQVVNSIISQKHFKLMNNKSEQICSNDDCSICLTDFNQNENISVLPCNHGFHPGCIDNWFKQKTTCPMCNKDFGGKKEKLRASTNEADNLLAIAEVSELEPNILNGIRNLLATGDANDIATARLLLQEHSSNRSAPTIAFVLPLGNALLATYNVRANNNSPKHASRQSNFGYNYISGVGFGALSGVIIDKLNKTKTSLWRKVANVALVGASAVGLGYLLSKKSCNNKNDQIQAAKKMAYGYVVGLLAHKLFSGSCKKDKESVQQVEFSNDTKIVG